MGHRWFKDYAGFWWIMCDNTGKYFSLSAKVYKEYKVCPHCHKNPEIELRDKKMRREVFEGRQTKLNLNRKV